MTNSRLANTASPPWSPNTLAVPIRDASGVSTAAAAAASVIDLTSSLNKVGTAVS